MLAGCWLLSDLDGTLISTPHKAHGHYMSLSESPCYGPIRRWLAHGGSVCIVTTADRRVLHQVYAPLRRYLQGGDMASPHTGTLLLSLYTGAVIYRCNSTEVLQEEAYIHGLHSPTDEAVSIARKKGLRSIFPRSQPTARAGAGAASGETWYVRGTCFTTETCRSLIHIVTEAFLAYSHDILTGDPEAVASLDAMSKRYRFVWNELLHYLEQRYQCCCILSSSGGEEGAAHSAAPSNDSGSLHLSVGVASSAYSGKLHAHRCGSEQHSMGNVAAQEAVLCVGCPVTPEAPPGPLKPSPQASNHLLPDPGKWKAELLRAHRDVLLILGFIRAEEVMGPAVGSTNDPGHVGCKDDGGLRSSCTAAKQEHCAMQKERFLQRCFEALGDSSSMARTFAESMAQMLGADLCPPALSRSECRNAAAAAAHPAQSSAAPLLFAQVIVVGLPLSMSARYFAPFTDQLDRLGVTPMAQPNSVVFAKMGISKSTTVRYLRGENVGAAHGEGNSTLVPSRVAFQPQLALALGDNPQMADYELTVFQDIPFLSLECPQQRYQRHVHIDRACGKQTGRNGATDLRRGKSLLAWLGWGSLGSVPAVEECAVSSEGNERGSLMDDRKRPNIHYVGWEEEGTALFLTLLMNKLHVPQLADGTLLFPSPEATSAAALPEPAVSGVAPDASPRVKDCGNNALLENRLRYLSPNARRAFATALQMPHGPATTCGVPDPDKRCFVSAYHEAVISAARTSALLLVSGSHL